MPGNPCAVHVSTKRARSRYRFVLAISPWFAHKTSDRELIRTCGKVGALALLLPSLYLACVVGSNWGGSIGGAASEGTGMGAIAISAGLGISA
jgi:hypothetical protein